MNSSLKNVFSFIKEALELKNKNIYKLSDYEIHEDLGQFYNKFKELISEENYLELNINSEQPILKLKYISDDKKKSIPSISPELEKYILLGDNSEIVQKIDDLELILKKENLLDKYKAYEKNIIEVNKYNNLIDSYNAKYFQFYNIYKRIKDYEEKIEIIFGHKLIVWADNRGNTIQRYIYEANLDIDVDPINNVITFLINDEKFKGFASDFLNLDAYKIKDTELFYDFVNNFNNDVINSDFDINDEAEKYINYVSYENKIMNCEADLSYDIKELTTYLFDNCGIIVRNKNVKLWIEDLEKIINSCDETKFKSPMLNMFEVDFSDDEQVNQLLNDNTYDKTKDDNVLFPLPSNDEQYKIVDKVKSSNIVLVQGPPGTGKSHTIANLISHYISEGKKVIVTSEKAKALEVLREKLPLQIRSLSLSLLTSSGVDKDLEFSINNVLKHQEDANEIGKMFCEIERLNGELNKVYLGKQEVNRKIIDLMAKDTICHKAELNELIEYSSDGNLTLMEIAKWLEKNRNYEIIPLSDIENYNYNNCIEFFDKLDDICDDIKNNNYAISSFVPEYEKFKTNDIELCIKEINGLNNYIPFNSELSNFIKQSGLDKSIVDELGMLLTGMNSIYKYFSKDFVKSNVKYPVFISKIKDLFEILKYNKDFIILTEQKMYDYKVDYDFNYNDIFDNINELINLYDENGNLSLFNKLKIPSILKKINGLKINEVELSKDTINKNYLIDIRDIIKYHLLVGEIKKKIVQIFEKDLFNEIDIKNNQFGKNQDEICEILNNFINFEKNSNNINLYFEKMINTNLFPINYINDNEDYIMSIYNDLKYYSTINLGSDNIKCIVNGIRDFYKNYNLQYLENVLVSVESNNLDDFINYKNNLMKEISIINQYNHLKEIYSKFVEDKKELINNYIFEMDSNERKFLKSNLDKILKYHYVEKYYLVLEEKEKILPSLFSERDKLINEEKKIIEMLVATKGWYYQNMNMTPAISLSLNKWINLKKKIGSGKGKNTNIYLRQMREEMKNAKNAIPVWIMPIDKLIEQYPFNNDPPFDVLIMDESSQSSVFSISALSRAKKVIIVGDDKQISPTNVFTSIDGINDIRTKYLRNNSWDLQISKDTSIYDIVQTICGNKKITLTEHFRCLPEIINYSNKTFYNMEINPLKVRSKENTISKPIKTIYVPDAVCKKSGVQIINEAEMNCIIELLADISLDKEYEHKTIGIITLQNNMSKYIEKLRNIIMQKFGEDFINDRKIKIGITYDFQGDERDVIILSMGISSLYSNGDKYSFRALTTQEFNRSFNVAASRAKEQMILVHSVKLDELSPACNRYKLLNYCLNYDSELEKNKEELFESNFERDIYYHLTSKGYNMTPQFKVGNYRLDFVLTNDNNQKIAIECDGDMYHGIDELNNDLKRQSTLERCGWKFARIRASEYYYDREKSINKLMELINHYLNGNNSIDFNIKNIVDNTNINSVSLSDNDISIYKDNSENLEIIDKIKQESNNFDCSKDLFSDLIDE